MDTLVLSHAYTPMARVRWQRAITWVIAGRVEVLEEYEDRPIRSATEVFPMPSVIRFLRKAAGAFRWKTVRFNRRNVWLRDGGRCQYCGRPTSQSEFTFDHVKPRVQGGTTSWENIVLACLPCNQRKRDRTPEQAGMRLLSKPAQPRSLPFAGLAMLGPEVPSSWRDYLGTVRYWTGVLEGS